MKSLLVLLIAAPLFAGSLETFTDVSLNSTQRNTACLALRGDKFELGFQSKEGCGVVGGGVGVSGAATYGAPVADLDVADIARDFREQRAVGADFGRAEHVFVRDGGSDVEVAVCLTDVIEFLETADVD